MVLRKRTKICVIPLLCQEWGHGCEQGSHDQLMEKGGEYCEMFTLQASGYQEEEENNDEN